jgi:23S rRNA pseudouridine2605 synthase
MEKIRLQKFFTDCGVMSRRAAEEEIRCGNVSVNGHTAQIGLKIDPIHDRVTYKGRLVTLPQNRDFVYILLNKPRGYATTTSDPHEKKCVLDLLEGLDARVYPVGRLDKVSEGLLILTNDGEMANKLTHPKHSIPKIYRVKVDGTVTEQQLAILTSALVIDGYTIQPVEVEIHDMTDDTTTLTFTLYEGRNRQIRKMCEQANLTVRRLNRIAIGRLKLGGLAVGKWRYLDSREIEYLRRATQQTQGR